MKLPSEVGVITLPHTTLFPHALLPLYIFEPRYRRMLDDSLHSSRMFCVAMRRPDSTRTEPLAVAGLGLIRACVKAADGTSNLILQGLARVELGRRVRLRPYRIHEIRPLVGAEQDTVAVDALCAKVLELVAERMNQGFQLPMDLLKQVVESQVGGSGSGFEKAISDYALKQGIQFLSKLNDPSQLADLVSCTLLQDAAERQMILETVDLENRLKNLIHFLLVEIRRNRKKGKGT